MKLSISLLSLLLVCGIASANNKDKADALFKQGKKLMAEKRYSDACAAFEQSYKLDPGIGAQLNIAKCYEEWGKIGRALISYQAAEKMAKDAKDPRAEKIHELVTGLDSQVPRLTIKIPKDASTDKLKVTLDNQKVDAFNEPRIVDPGPHMIEWSVAGGLKRTKVVPVERGGDSEVTLEVPKADEVKPDKGGGDKGGGDKGGGDKGGGDQGGGDQGGGDQGKKDDEVAKPPTPGRNQRIGGLVLGGAGVIAIGVSSIMTFSARGQYKDALDMYCGGVKTNCDPMGLELTADARGTANTATIVFLAGTAMVGGGVALYLLAPKGERAPAADDQAKYLVPTVTPSGGGIVFGGKF